MRVFLAVISMVSFAPQHMGSGDAVQSRDTQSVIESITPALPSDVKVSIVGSDTFFRVESIGHEVQVPGYEGEPYMRINASGRVQVNDASQTTILNSNRYGNVDLSTFKKSDVPKWRTIATNGSAMWHDHRVHWMNPIRPGTIDDRGTVLKWSVPVVVDGKKVVVSGSLYLRESASKLWWLVAIASLVVAALVAMKSLRALRVMTMLLSLAGFVVGMLEFVGLPTGARITPTVLMFSTGALALSAVSLVGRRVKLASHITAAFSAGAGATMLVVVWLCVDQVTSAYVPGLTAIWAARSTLTAMTGVGIVAIVDAYVRIARGLDGE